MSKQMITIDDVLCWRSMPFCGQPQVIGMAVCAFTMEMNPYHGASTGASMYVKAHKTGNIGQPFDLTCTSCGIVTDIWQIHVQGKDPMWPTPLLNTTNTCFGRLSQVSKFTSLRQFIVSCISYCKGVAISHLPCALQHEGGPICLSRWALMQNKLNKVILLQLLLSMSTH